MTQSDKHRPISPLLYILLSGALGVAGQLILKVGLASLGPLALRPDAFVSLILRLALNPTIVLGLLVYATGTFFWLIALSNVDLGYAYPFASLNYLLILLASWTILREPFAPTRLVGVAFICLGVWAITRTSTRTEPRENQAIADPRLPVSEGIKS